MCKWLIKQALVASLIIGLYGCGGGIGGGGTGGGIAGGGIGGTGSIISIGGIGVGEITGFGSVRLDDDSVFQTDDQTRFFIDDVEIENENSFRAAFGGSNDSVGALAIVQVRDDVNADFTSGTASRVDAFSTVKGAVTGLNPLRVLGQEVVTTGNTILADLPGGIAGLNTGNQIEVHGFRDSNAGVILASRIQLKPAGLVEWKLTGFVTASASNTFNLGSQVVSLAATQARDCGNSTPAVGRFVEVKANPLIGFGSGDTLVASDVECLEGGLIGQLDDIPEVSLLRIQGFISAVSASTFTVGGVGNEGQVVQWSTSTTFQRGISEDLTIGTKVEVIGQVDSTNGVLNASRVSFRETRVRIEGTLLSTDVDTSERTSEIFGISVRSTALTRDEENFFGGVQPDRDVRIEGFVDQDGTIFATRIDDRGTAGDRDLRLRGPVDAGSIIEPTFSILGVQINPGAGTDYQDERFGDNNNIDQATFFGALSNGAPVQVHADPGSFNPAGPSIDLPTEIELED